ncbi:hypothetical protein BSKO_11237 [Bryopsis sp. KO-2023]|nr:hypothetical protein BSKO_11237 [Bryopsis sp. KO-2023]
MQTSHIICCEFPSCHSWMESSHIAACTLFVRWNHQCLSLLPGLIANPGKVNYTTGESSWDWFVEATGAGDLQQIELNPSNLGNVVTICFQNTSPNCRQIDAQVIGPCLLLDAPHPSMHVYLEGGRMKPRAHAVSLFSRLAVFNADREK